MEVHGAVALSLDYNLHYLTFIGDGDSKSFKKYYYWALWSWIQGWKSDCWSCTKAHGNSIEKVKKDYGKRKISDGCTIGSAGRLTEQLCDDFQRYYSNTILDDLQGVIKAVKAILHYSLSTNEAPDHQYCFKGEPSWCKFQHANATAQTPPAIRTRQRYYTSFCCLSKESLLQCCLKGSTQNRNESLHATVWNRCPKSQSGSLEIVETELT